MILAHYTQPAVAGFPRRCNVGRGQQAPITIAGAVAGMRWGLLAPWRGHGGVRPPPIYVATLAEVAATPVLRRAKHCLVHADGCFAWQRGGSKPRPMWLHVDAPIAFAGLTATHTDDGVAAFAIVVSDLAPYAHPVPVLATTEWLAGGVGSDLFDTPTWRAHEVSRYFEDLAHDDEQCIAPLGNPAQGSLF